MVKVIAELGINHNGDLEIAKKLIDVAWAAGCDYVKFQKRDIDSVYTQEELDTYRESPWGTTTKKQKEGLEFGYQDYVEIDRYCKSKGIKWFASPWDMKSFNFLMDFNLPFMKIPSALITNNVLLTACVINKIPTILSTGMSTGEEIHKAVEILGEYTHCIMHCTSTYPTSPDEINIKAIHYIFEYCQHVIEFGFSNHYPGLMAMLLAVAYGADMIEFHITLDRTMYGSDQAASIEPKGVFELMEKIELIEKMMGDGRKRVYDSELPIIKKLRR